MITDSRTKESPSEIQAWEQTLARLRDRWRPEMEQLKLTTTEPKEAQTGRVEAA